MIPGAFGPYHDGTDIRWADALAAWRAMERLLGDPEQALLQIAEASVAQAIAAEAALVSATRQALCLKDFDTATGSGATDLHAKRLGMQLIERSRQKA